MAKLRVNNQLVETSSEEFKKEMEKRGRVVPTSPAAGAAAGANPDQAKMLGTEAQKFVNIKSSPKTDLQTADRREENRKEQTQSERDVAAKAGQLSALDGLDDRVKGLVNAQFNQQNTQPTATSFNQDAIDSLGVDDQDGLQTLLTQYQSLVSTNPADPAINQVLADLQNNYGVSNPDELIRTDAGVTGDLAAANIMDPSQVTIGALDLSELGYTPEQLTDLLGADVQNMSLEEFSRQVETVRNAEFSKIQTLKAQYASLPAGSAQRQVVLEQLKDLGQVGVTGLEQGVQQLQDQIDASDEITFAGQQYTVDQLLADDNVSSLVTDYLSDTADPKWKEKLKAENPEFVKWIESNQEGLKQLAEGMGSSQEGFATVQEDQTALATVGEDGATLSDKVMEKLIPGWGTAVSSVTDLSENGIYQAVQADSDILNKLNGDPSSVDELANLTSDQIQAASDAGDALVADPDLASIVGAEGKAFVTDEDTLQMLSQLKPLVDMLRERGGNFETMLTEEGFQDLIRSGDINADNIEEFMENPETYDEWKGYQNLLEEFDDIQDSQDLDSIVSFLFGEDGLDADALNDQYDALERAAKDPTDTGAVARWKALQKLDSNKDGRIDKKDAAAFLSMIEKGLGNFSFQDGLDGKDLGFGLADSLSKSIQPMADVGENAFLNSLELGLKKSGKIGYEDIVGELMGPYADKLFSMPKSWKKKYLDPRFDTAKEVAAYTKKLKQQEEAAAVKSKQDTYAREMGSTKLHTKNLWGTKPEDLNIEDVYVIDTMLKNYYEALEFDEIPEGPAKNEALRIIYQLQSLQSGYQVVTKRKKIQSALDKKNSELAFYRGKNPRAYAANIQKLEREIRELEGQMP